jgi:biopolymer transport protein ExbD
MQVSQSGAITAEMNVTPMIDVLLVLIIVAIILLALEAKLLLNVPVEDTRQVPSPHPAIVLELDPTGGYAINGRRVSEAGLEARLEALFVKRSGQILFVRASGQRSYQEVIHAIDVARSAGVGVIGYMP